MQSRDPFSGDCDRRINPRGFPDLPGPLAEPRPVLRGLRLVHDPSCTTHPPPCRAETRSQGIATSSGCSAIHSRIAEPCRAETRSQGIATRDGELQSAGGAGPLAEPRPVLRGLRPLRKSCHAIFLVKLVEPRPVLRGLRRMGFLMAFLLSCHGLQSRDPFSGDCDPVCSPHLSPLRRLPCRAETRSQGIATSSPYRGAQQNPFTLQSRDPFSGDCNQSLDLRRGSVGRDLHACRAKTRSQGIATHTSCETPRPSGP